VFDHLWKVAWSRAARTDKGVSALGNCVSLKMILLPDIIDKINAHLPSEIRVFEMERVSKRFSPKNRCDSRIYEYIIPTYVFKYVGKKQHQSQSQQHQLQSQDQSQSQSQPQQLQLQSQDQSQSQHQLQSQDQSQQQSQPQQLQTTPLLCEKDFEFNDEVLQRVNTVLRKYVGSHNFHNFTNSLHPRDPRCQRVIHRFEVLLTILL
jgi:tRNA pseudouridine38-40 synthase